MTDPTEESIFNSALNRADRADQSSFLDQACGDDVALRRRIEQLLFAYGDGEYLEAPAASLTATVDLRIDEKPGTVIGPYKLLEQIGEGGMGLVFMAEQARPIRRRVAIKLIKPGLDTRSVVARFEAERQALALMDHPNIAHVYDAGTTDSGRPYFVMELVRGIPITEYCNERQLDLVSRLNLFVQVCRAIQHAHQKGIIHRDLKPTNILVAHDDTSAVPKVIDFGVAKATTQQLTDRTLFTQFSQIIGTPLYMSPEQAELSYQDVDTRSDVYSLGIVLYELLTGTTPLDQARLRNIGIDEIRRIIREEDPPKPSARATTLAAATTFISKANTSQRVVAPPALRGELDWIVMKALEKNRGRRYESPGAFAADIQRYLADEPVEAAAPTLRYRISKFTRRNRWKLVAGALIGIILLSITTSMIRTAWLRNVEQSRLNNNVRQELAAIRTAVASQNPELAEKHLDRANVLVQSSGESSPSLNVEMSEAKAAIKASRDDLQAFAHFCDLAQRAADDSTFDVSLGGDRVAEEALSIVHVLDRADWQDELRHTSLSDVQKERVRESVYTTLICLADFQVRWDANNAKAKRALELLEKAECVHTPTRAFYWIRGNAHRLLGDGAARKVDVERAKTAPTDFAWDYYLEGHTAGWNGNIDLAMQMYKQALQIQPDHFNSLFYLALRYGEKKNDPIAAAGYLSACVALRPNHALSYHNRGEYLLQTGDPRTAVADFDLAIKHTSRTDTTLISCLWRSAALEQIGKIAEAEQDRRSAIRQIQKLKQRSSASLNGSLHVIIQALCVSMRTCEDEQLRDELWQLAQSLADYGKSVDSQIRAELLNELGALGLGIGKLDEAESLLSECLNVRELKTPDDWPRFTVTSLLGEVLSRQGKTEQAEQLLLAGYRGLEVREAKLGPLRSKTLHAAAKRLAVFYEASDRAEEAEKWHKASDAAWIPGE